MLQSFTLCFSLSWARVAMDLPLGQLLVKFFLSRTIQKIYYALQATGDLFFSFSFLKYYL